MFRQIWMFPRNKRKMPPLETALILRAMVVASELGTSWGGDQGQQDKFSRLLDQYGLKKGGKPIDQNPGGARTYESQMSLLGLIYKDEEGQLILTQAGEDLVSFNETAKTFEHQVLKVQFPSAYSMSRGVNLDTQIKIRPFIFLLKLAHDPDINGLSDRDMIVPVVFGRTSESFDVCKNLIRKLRAEGVSSVVPDDGRIRTNKTIHNSYEKRIADISDIANTFKNILESSGLVDLREVDGEIRVFPKIETIGKVQAVDSLPFVDFVGLPKDQASLQYGKRVGAVKDTRRVFMPSKAPELFSKSGLIYQKFLSDVGLPASQSDVDDFVTRVTREFNVRPEQVLDALQPILFNKEQFTQATLLELSKGGTKTAEAFEKIVTKIFEVDFCFESHWIGRAQREKTGGHMDVFVVEVERNLCGIIDTKSMNIYDLPHQDVAKATTTYIDAARELYGSRNLDLKFVGYVSHLISSGARTRALDIYQSKKIPVCLISAYGLNSMRANSVYKGNPMAVTEKLSSESVGFIV